MRLLHAPATGTCLNRQAPASSLAARANSLRSYKQALVLLGPQCMAQISPVFSMITLRTDAGQKPE